jgi:probable aminopeptidase NPEPL1
MLSSSYMFVTRKSRLISADKFRECLGSFPVRVSGNQNGGINRTVLVGQSLERVVKSRLGDAPKEIVDSLLKDGGSTFVGNEKISVVKIPNESSRQNCPSRPDMVLKSLKSLTEKEPVNVGLCVKSDADVLPSAIAVYRACPVVSFKSDKKQERKVAMKIVVDNGTDGVREASEDLIKSVEVLGENVRMAQALTDLPPNELNPETFTDIVLEMVGKKQGVKAEVFTNCEEKGFLGLHSVGKGSMHKPRMIVLTHTLESDESIIPDTESVALVGKGICFDSGGYSLKGSQFQIGMKRDMGGAAAAFGAFMSLVESSTSIRRPKTVFCILCLAENMIGPNAFRNDDVIQLYSGKTIEINNTDAEGRLILGDGLAYAHKDLEAQVIVDIATLTGAASIASGKSHASVFSPNEELMEKLVNAGKNSGDLVHELVFCPELHREGLKSTIADMKNVTGKGSDAASSVAATFLYDNLVGSGFKTGKWAHVDMASVAENGERSTGYGVALLALLVQSL